MKDAIKAWLVSFHGLTVYDEPRWENKTIVAPRGAYWVIEALTVRGKTVTREGPTAKVIAGKLMMMPIADLHYFGVRSEHNVSSDEVAAFDEVAISDAIMKGTGCNGWGLHSTFPYF